MKRETGTTNFKYTLHIEEDCSYLLNEEEGNLYISSIGEDLRELVNCNDYLVIDINEYKADNEEDTIQEFINKCVLFNHYDELKRISFENEYLKK